MLLPVGRLTLGTLVAALASMALAPAAGAYVYWMSYDSGNSRIGRANLDGSHVKPGLVKGISYGAAVASDGKHVYWGESGSNPTFASIGRASLAGKHVNRQFQNGATYCGIFGVSATASELFWLKSDCGNRDIDAAPLPNPGGGYTEPVAGGQTCGFTVDSHYIYWSAGQYIARAKLNGNAPNPTWLDLGTGNAACGVAVDANHVYWTAVAPADNYRGRSIGRAKIDGSESSVENNFIKNTFFVVGNSNPSGIAVDKRHIYWSNQPDYPGGDGIHGSIGRATLAGKHVDQKFVPHVFSPDTLDVDGH
jgi:hypothetical protein